MSAENQRDAAVAPGGADRNRLLVARRRMLRRSLGAVAPAVATLTSGPVSAGSCVVASSFISAATFNSRHPQGMSACAGQSPTAWYSAADWSSVGLNKSAVKFNACLGTGGTKYQLAPDQKLADLLAQSSTMLAYVVALWLNAKAGLTAGVFTPLQVVAIWQNIVDNSGGYKVPTETLAWTPARTMDWLALTWKP